MLNFASGESGRGRDVIWATDVRAIVVFGVTKTQGVL